MYFLPTPITMVESLACQLILYHDELLYVLYWCDYVDI